MENLGLLRCKDVTVVIKTKKKALPILDRLNFSVDAGEILGIVGESGCGKSITSLSIMGLLPRNAAFRTEGEICFNGTELLSLKEQKMRQIRGKEIAMIFQDPMTSLNPLIPVGKQIIETLMAHEHISYQTARTRAEDILSMVEISSPNRRMDQYPHEFSGGMKQRIMIAMALCCKPKLLIADEPTTALDVTVQAQIMALLRRLRRETGTAIILITHDLGVVFNMADRVLVMYAGQIVESSETRHLFEKPLHPYTRGLIDAIPSLKETRETLNVIPGTVPPPDKVSPGCRFYQRCSQAADTCTLTEPETLQWEKHTVKCWLYAKKGEYDL
jgi:oligopeptide/dipeptide ABC transporter ATP-binding protein